MVEAGARRDGRTRGKREDKGRGALAELWQIAETERNKDLWYQRSEKTGE